MWQTDEKVRIAPEAEAYLAKAVAGAVAKSAKESGLLCDCTDVVLKWSLGTTFVRIACASCQRSWRVTLRLQVDRCLTTPLE